MYRQSVAACLRRFCGVYGRHLLVIVAAIATISASQVVQGPRMAFATSTLGSQITRSEVISRAVFWYNERDSLTYNSSRDPSTFYSDPLGDMYAPDCSGYVSMAWHVAFGQPGESAGGYNTWHLPDISTQITFDQLQSGDLIDDVSAHAILFDQWESDHIHFSYYSFGSTPIKHVTHAARSDSTWLLTAIRFDRVAG